ncbi:MAG TPA: LTA synthase family protein [Woeseiaceae bacterium]|nr:LTA synthase family protein [Woeseiaceae bacterium]
MNHEFDWRANLATSLTPLFAVAWRLILALTAARVLLVAWQWDRVVDANMLAPVFVQGLRFDLVLLGLLLIPAVITFPLLASSRVLVPVWRFLLRIYLPIALLAAIFMELSTPSFIEQFDSRPNILFVEYLDHPKEVFSTLWAAYKIPLVLAVLFIALFGAYTFRSFARLTAPIRRTGLVPALVATPLLLIACLGMVRSTLDHRPVNPSTVALSTDPLVNDLALSSTYSLLYAIYETRHEEGGGIRYGEMDDETVISIVRDSMDVDSWEFTLPELPTLHLQYPVNPSGEPKNLVIIIEESLGAEFVGSLGGLDLTPNLDRYAEQGIWLNNLYATGTRSVRGLEAIVSGFTPTSARSVVKLGKSQKNFFTLAEVLGRHGYNTSFIYGGEAQFDNMRRFFVNNGFDRIIDEKDYDNPVFTGSWGVSDEDLFDRAHEEFSRSHSQPFFTLVFTSSNHSPYEYPDNRIEQFDAEKNTVNNAVKYADFALGRFLDRARDSDYWDNTVFLVVADHNSRVYGSEVVPVERFHIPGLILGGAIEPAVIETVASQVDLAPTVLSLIGVTSEHPMIGHDLTQPGDPDNPGRAIMQFNATQAYMSGDRVAILQKDLPPLQFVYRDGRLQDDGRYDQALTETAIAHAAWSSMAYEKSLYRLPDASETLVGWVNHRKFEK